MTILIILIAILILLLIFICFAIEYLSGDINTHIYSTNKYTGGMNKLMKTNRPNKSNAGKYTPPHLRTSNDNHSVIPPNIQEIPQYVSAELISFDREYCDKTYPMYVNILPPFNIWRYDNPIECINATFKYAIIIKGDIPYAHEIYNEIFRGCKSYSINELRAELLKPESQRVKLDFMLSMRHIVNDEKTGRTINETEDISTNIKGVVKSYLDGNTKCMTVKNRLYMNICDAGYSQYMAKTTDIRNNPAEIKRIRETLTQSNNMSPLILKPYSMNTMHGLGIHRITNIGEFDAFINGDDFKKYNQMYNSCEYITNHWLINGRKFHIRAFMLVRLPLNKTETPLHDYDVRIHNICRILTAKDKFIKGEYDNDLIHDTHVSSTIDIFDFPSSFTPEHITTSNHEPLTQSQIDDIKSAIYKQFRELETVFLGIVRKNKISCYADSDYAFEEFGIDLLVQDDGSLIMLECNKDAGHVTVENKVSGIINVNQQFVDNYYKRLAWLFEYGALPFYRILTDRYTTTDKI